MCSLFFNVTAQTQFYGETNLSYLQTNRIHTFIYPNGSYLTHQHCRHNPPVAHHQRCKQMSRCIKTRSTTLSTLPEPDAVQPAV